MNEQHYEITGKLTDGISVGVYTQCGGYNFRINFLAGNPADTRDEVMSFFYNNGRGGTFTASHGGNPHMAEITDFLIKGGYRRRSK
jgi:hypothetical protein